MAKFDKALNEIPPKLRSETSFGCYGSRGWAFQIKVLTCIVFLNELRATHKSRNARIAPANDGQDCAGELFCHRSRPSLGGTDHLLISASETPKGYPLRKIFLFTFFKLRI